MSGRSAASGDPAPDTSARVTAAFGAVPRQGFLPRRERRRAAFDRALVIGHGQTNSQPTTVRNMLRLLAVEPGDLVLDVGSGSGWTTALLAELTGPSGQVYGVELVPELVAFGAANLSARQAPWATIVAAETGVLGLPQHAPYDRILVSAEARELPRALVDQLGPGGRMVAPVAGRLSVVDRDGEGAIAIRRVGHYAFVPLHLPKSAGDTADS
jgi:protein-L-isoaspartate(D-aspartate) O-methyltransferase